ncbi:MAG: hypothetical protein ACOYNO_06040 [Saprospiraceae bacterium]|jgi:hypothetical protein
MKHNTLTRNLRLFLILFLVACVAAAVEAQCPMCRISVESNLKNGGSMGRGLNAGIMYMLAMPYLIVAGIGYWWWRNRKPDAAVDVPDEWLEEDSVRNN